MTSLDGADAIPLDGRRRRRVENREAVVGALLELFEAAGSIPTVAEVAERAGISPRSVFRYFDDVEALTRAAIEVRFREAMTLGVLTPPIPAGIDDRIDLIAESRVRLFAFMGSTARLARSAAQQNPLVAETIAHARGLMREQIARLFSAELDALGPAGPDRLAALDLLLSFESVDLMLSDQGRSHAEAARVLAAATAALLR